MKPPPFTAVFQANYFPGWGRDKKPVKHRRFNDKTHEYDGEEYVCDMACHTPGGTCVSVRYNHCGPVGIDRKGGVWLLVQDFAIAGPDNKRWIKYPAKAIA